MPDDDVESDLYGDGLLGEALAPKRTGNLAERFMVPPFTVLSARDGYWQDRKRAWIALGIKSELGRGGALTYQGEIAHDLEEGTRRDHAAPGGSLMPAMDYKKREHGNSTGKPIEGTAAAQPVTLAPKPVTFVAPNVARTAREAPGAAHVPLTPVAAPQPPVVAGARAMRIAPVLAQSARLAIAYNDPFLKAQAEKIARVGPGKLAFDETDWDHNSRGAVGFDVECFQNFFCICFKRFSDGRRLAFERSQEHELDIEFIERVVQQNVLISFNGTTYDLPMIYLALRGANTDDLKIASNRIVSGNMKPWEIEKGLGVRVPHLNHIDLMEPNPSVRMGLKMLYARLHGRFLVDLPFPPEAILTQEQMNITTLYCHNDLDATEVLYKAMREPLELRSALGKTYSVDFRSKSDAQIGESIVKLRIEAETGKRIVKSVISEPSFEYDTPSFINFSNPDLCGVLDKLRDAKFHVIDGKIAPPELLKDLKISIGKMVYSMGIGGLHSTEAHRALVSNDESFLLDVDVASHYPKIIMKLGLYPKALGPAFLNIYDKIIQERMIAKAEGDKVKAEGGKIQINGIFGKLGSSYSPLYAPHLMIAVTLTGQLAVLMLIERAEIAGIPVVSANTDGVVFYCPRCKAAELDMILAQWETDTSFTIEQTPYSALYSASVNTYVAIKEDGKTKRKGAIADPWSEEDLRGQMSKNPQMTVCSEAVVKYLIDGVPLAETIRRCIDPRMFVTVIRVAAGGVWRGHKLGRVVRYYWSIDGEPISYIDGVRKVAKTDGARPMSEMTGSLPPDLDRARYVAEATKIAVDLGIPEFIKNLI